jgi:hypothetical protein
MTAMLGLVSSAIDPDKARPVPDSLESNNAIALLILIGEYPLRDKSLKR